MDRFEQGLPDPQAVELLPIQGCSCGCPEAIYPGEEYVEYDGKWFFSERCVASYVGADRRVVGE